MCLNPQTLTLQLPIEESTEICTLELLPCRFDLLHVMIDEPDEFVDTAIAKHILAVHRQQARVLDVPYTLEQMQRYICFARSIRPQLTSEVSL